MSKRKWQWAASAFDALPLETQQLRRGNQGSDGPRDKWRDREDAQALRGLTLRYERCEEAGVDPAKLREWFGGIVLHLAPEVGAYWAEDYASVLQNPVEAAEEMDRLAKEHKLMWYDLSDHPPDLDVVPSSIIILPKRNRSVHDWTAVGVNQNMYIPPVAYGSLDLHVSKSFVPVM